MYILNYNCFKHKQLKVLCDINSSLAYDDYKHSILNTVITRANLL